MSDVREERLQWQRASDSKQCCVSETAKEQERRLTLRQFQYRAQSALMETPDNREERLQRQRVRAQHRHEMETPEEREACLHPLSTAQQQ